MYEPYNEETASVEDRIAWALCQIIDDDAPMRWTRYRFAANCIAMNPEVMADLLELQKKAAPNAEIRGGGASRSNAGLGSELERR
jgi:hypothetical protein